jgi:hypothetical protein
MIPPDLGSLRVERFFLAGIVLVLVHVLFFLILSRLGLVHGRHLLAFAAAGVTAWAFFHLVLPAQTFLTEPDSRTILISLAVIGLTGVVFFVVCRPGYVLAGHDPIIVPTLADVLLSHPTAMDFYRPGDAGFAYPPGYPILFSIISSVLSPLHALLVFKAATIIVVLLLPFGWAWMASRVFRMPMPFWAILLLAYVAVFGLERTVTFTLEYGKNAQVLAGAVFPFLVGLLLIATRKNIGVPFASAALVGAILLHYSVLYMVVSFFAAYVLIHFPRKQEDWLAVLRLALTGMLSLGVFLLLMKEAFNDPRAGRFASPHPVEGMKRMTDVLLGKYDELLFIFNEPSFTNYASPYRGLFLIGCVLLSLSIAYLLRAVPERSFAVARMAGIWAIMWLIGIAFAAGAVEVGITPDFTRWYLVFPQLAVILAALCAVTCYARGQQRGKRAASCGLGGMAILATVLATSDLVGIADAYRTQPVSRAHLTNVRDVLADTVPCFLITQSFTMFGGLHTVQFHKPLEYAEILTGCKILNGSFVQRGIPEGRAVNGLPTAAALASLPPGASIFLIVPESLKALYQATLPNAEFVRRQAQIGNLPVWRIRPGS